MCTKYNVSSYLCFHSFPAPSGGPERPAEGGHAWHPGGRLPVLPAGPLHGADLHLPGLPVLTPAGPGDHREEGRPH